MPLFSKKIGIDLGTTTSLVWVIGQGIVVNEPTVVAASVEENRVVAIGGAAKQMVGRTPGNILVSQPLRHGVIADYAITEALLHALLQRATKRRFFSWPEVMVSVPAGSTQVERRAVLDAVTSAGARIVYLVDAPLAALVGAGVSISEASGNMVLDIGGGGAEAAIISLGGVVVSKSIRTGGSTLDEAIVAYVRRKYSLVIGDQTAEVAKTTFGILDTTSETTSKTVSKEKETLEIKGRDTTQGLPRQIVLSNKDVKEALQKPLGSIVDMVKRVLEEVPPELASDIIDKGIVLTGGTSLLPGLDTYLVRELGVPVSIAEDPMVCTIRGIEIILKDIESYKHALGTQS